MNYSIKEISARLNIPASTLRYYEKRGIIGPLARRAGQVRVFSEADLKLLQIVQCLKKTGMPIEEIRQFAELIRQAMQRSVSAPIYSSITRHRLSIRLNSCRKTSLCWRGK